jgi:hypothetical protein
MNKRGPNRFSGRIFSFVKKNNSFVFALASAGIKINPNPNSNSNYNTNTNTNTNTDYNSYIIDY